VHGQTGWGRRVPSGTTSTGRGTWSVDRRAQRIGATLSTPVEMGRLASPLGQLGGKGFRSKPERRKRKAYNSDLGNTLNNFV
jgi:hypothetical protein